MTRAGIANGPDSIGAALRLLVDALTRERALFVSGVVGLALGLVGLLVAAVHGPIIEPEGVLSKAITFDIAIGIYVLTISLFVPLAGYSEKGLARWRLWQVGLTYVAYGFENIQIARGLDPRFTTHGSATDQMLGGVFFRLFVDLSTRIRGSWSSCNPMKIGVFLSFARSISRFCGGRLRGPRSWMGGLLGGVHA